AFPIPIRRHTFQRYLSDYYGVGKSLVIWAEDWPRRRAPQPIDVGAIDVADLTGWRYHPRSGRVAVDPELGRIAFPPGQYPREGVHVSYFYGFSADIGGGEYDRPVLQPPILTIPDPTALASRLRTAADPISSYLKDKLAPSTRQT